MNNDNLLLEDFEKYKPTLFYSLSLLYNLSRANYVLGISYSRRYLWVLDKNNLTHTKFNTKTIISDS